MREAIGNLLKEAATGFLLAAVMVLVFLRSWRPTLIVILAGKNPLNDSQQVNSVGAR